MGTKKCFPNKRQKQLNLSYVKDMFHNCQRHILKQYKKWKARENLGGSLTENNWKNVDQFFQNESVVAVYKDPTPSNTVQN